MKKLTERAWRVIGEGIALNEPACAIQGQRRFESRPAPRFETKRLQAASPRLGDHMIEQQRRRASTQITRMGSHRFQLAKPIPVLLQRPNSRDVFTVPNRPNRNLRRLKPRKIERENMARRRAGVHAREMQSKQLPRGRS